MIQAHCSFFKQGKPILLNDTSYSVICTLHLNYTHTHSHTHSLSHANKQCTDYFNIFWRQQPPGGYYNQFVPQLMLGNVLANSTNFPDYEPQWLQLNQWHIGAQYFMGLTCPQNTTTTKTTTTINRNGKDDNNNDDTVIGSQPQAMNYNKKKSLLNLLKIFLWNDLRFWMIMS